MARRSEGMDRVGALIRLAVTLLGVAATVVIPSSGALARSGIRLVHYRGLTLRVPASWPVFRLTDRSTTCVRFNRHAVYLGHPGSDQVCPANALGRTESILLQPAAGSSAPSARPAGAAQELQLVRHGVAVTATWGSDPGLVERALGLPRLPQQPEQAPAADRMTARTSTAAARSSSAATGASTVPLASATASRRPGLSTYTGLAFDTCSAPTTTQLSAWKKHSPYRGMGVYIGGANAACAQPNLTPGWISSVTGAGWHLLLIYVGLQAPKNSCGCAPIHPADAAAQGSAAADDAANRAAALGLGHGSPIYFDMEGYTERTRIRTAVLSFLAAWTTELHHDGYRSGVYSSADSGIADLVSSYGSGYPEPDELWFADWNNQATASAPYIPSTEWAKHQRAHQFLGAHNLSYGGLRMNVDSDYVDGATVGRRSSGGPTPSGPPAPHGKPPGKKPPAKKPSGSGHRRHRPSRRTHTTPPPSSPTGNGALVEVRGTRTVYRIVGGAPLLIRYWQDIGGRQPVRQISSRRFHQLRAVPKNGSLLYTVTGTAYRIAGGFPFALTTPAHRNSGAQLIDLWDLRHLSDPKVHLHGVPSDGTLIEAAPSGRFWAFENGHLFRSKHTAGAIPVPDIDLGPWLTHCTAEGGTSGGSGFGASCRAASAEPSGANTGGGGLAGRISAQS